MMAEATLHAECEQRNFLPRDSESETIGLAPTDAMLHQKYEQQNTLQTAAERDTFTFKRYEQFQRYFPRSARRVLDVGCATGRGGLRLKQIDPSLSICGLDCVKSRLAELPDCYDQRIYGLSNAIPAGDGEFDAVFAGEFLEHLYPSDVDNSICEFQRVLSVGGRLLLTTPNPHYLKNTFQKSSIYSVSHLTQHFPSVLKHRLKMHGFSHVRIVGSGKVSRYVGYHFPLLAVYGSYLIFGDKI
jgi:ubiquinone/menaquinone biosynthesis C-methylase UbiE